MKSVQNENVLETNGESNNFEGPVGAKTKIVEIHWKHIAFLATQILHVRQAVGNVMRAQRCKM